MIYLASTSPRRKALLKQINIEFEALDIAIDETPFADENPQNYVNRMALAKARAGYRSVLVESVLAADTVVVCAGKMFGKPKDAEEARWMLKKLSGIRHQVLTAVALVNKTKQSVRLNVNNVYFKMLDDDEIESYILTGEPFDKAGSYAIQGLASVFIQRIEGSYTGVMGLPLYETAVLLSEIGINVFTAGNLTEPSQEA
jgi:septum formation protein